MQVCTSSHTTRLWGLVLFAERLWGRVNDNHRGINLVSKEIAHDTCQFVHETQIDIEIKQHLYCDIREFRVYFECEWLPQPCKLARQMRFADQRRIFKSLCLSDFLTCVIYSLSYLMVEFFSTESWFCCNFWRHTTQGWFLGGCDWLSPRVFPQRGLVFRV